MIRIILLLSRRYCETRLRYDEPHIYEDESSKAAPLFVKLSSLWFILVPAKNNIATFGAHLDLA